MNEDDPTQERATGFEAGQGEREAIYPDDGFVLAEIDMMKPLGDALTPLYRALTLSAINLPPTTELIDYVIYDSDGRDYGHTSLESMVERVETDRINELIEDAGADDTRTRRLALYGLSRAAKDRPEACLDAIPVLTSNLEAPQLDIQAASLEILRMLAAEHPDQVTPAADLVIDRLVPKSDSRLQEDAVRFVSAVAGHDPAAVIDAPPRLAALLQSSTDDTAPAITALKRIAEPYPDAVVPVTPELFAYLKDGSTSERAGVLSVLGMLAKAYPDVAEETIPQALGLLDAEDLMLRANAAGLLADLADEYPDQVRPSVPKVIHLLDDDDEKVRYNCTSILARIAKTYPQAVEPAVDPLIEMLDDDFKYSRGNACWALGYIQAERALAALEEREQSDSSEEVQEAAEWAIANIRRGM